LSFNKKKDDARLSYTYNASTARLHISCARALVDPAKRDTIGGQSFFSVDFDGGRWDFLEEVESTLVEASKGKYKIVRYNHMNPILLEILAVVADVIDWFYDGNVRNDFFQLAAKYAVIGYGKGDLHCDATKSQRLLNFVPVSREVAMKESAQKYFE